MQQRSSTSAETTGYVLALGVCLGALLALRLASVFFAEIDLGPDEAQYWSWSRDLAAGYFSKPPLIAWLIRGTSELCGQSEACLRSASPILYTLAAFMLFLAGRALYDARVGFWSAIVFATLPGISFSSLLITTDVPLILLWTIVLYAWVMLVKRQSLGFTVLLGAAVGAGLLAKQAMAYALLCIACHAAVSRDARQALAGGRAVVAALIALALFAPNIVWNYENGFSTVRHTGANVGWRYPYFHPLQAFEFIGAQFGLFGPILFVVLLRAAWREIREPTDTGRVLLLCFSLPVLALLIVQALLSRAHGNWSATAYPAASILVTHVLLELNRQSLFRISIGLHLVMALLVAAAPAFAQRLPLFGELQFLRSVIGWRETADAVRGKLAANRYGSLLVDTRDMAAELLYYLRDMRTPLHIWPSRATPRNHFEMTRPFTPQAPEPLLLVSLRPCPAPITASFGSATPLGTEHVALGEKHSRTLYFCRLADYRGRPRG